MSVVNPLDRMFNRLPQIEKGSTIWFLSRDRIAMINLAIILVFALAAILAPVLTPYPKEGAGEPNVMNKLMPPSLEHPFGTEGLGRDILARVLFGARTSLIAGFAIVSFSILIGTILGAVAGFFGGRIDEIIMRITDIFLAFPPLLLAMVVAAVLKPSLTNAILSITLTWWPWYTRLARAQALSVRERDFVRAARGIGVNKFTIIRRHIIPNILTPILVQGTLDLGAAILTLSSLSFLGLGVPPPQAEWGAMIREGRIYIQNGKWWVPTFPGIVLFLTITAFNLLGDGVQVTTNPKTRGETL